MKNKKKIALGAGALAVVMVAAGTFAWFTTTDKVENVFGMDNFDVTITEAFDKDNPIPLVPGTDVTKEVGVTNSGNVPVIVRVKLEETLSLLQMEDNAPDGTVDKIKVVYETTADKTKENGYVPVLISDEMIKAYTTNGYTTYTTSVPQGITVLRKETTGTAQANTVYSYLAYVSEASPTGSGNHHLVQVTPVIATTGTAAKPENFEVKYAYNIYKDATTQNGDGAVGGLTGLTVTHGKGDAKLDDYYGSDFHKTDDFQKPYAVELNFADKVQTDGAALKDANTAAWYLAKDGYFYYTKALDGTSISEPLLKSVSISEKAGNAFKGATYTITPVMEAVQMDWDAVKATWKEFENSNTDSVAAVTTNSAEQLVYNIVKTGKGYYTPTVP